MSKDTFFASLMHRRAKLSICVFVLLLLSDRFSSEVGC